MKIDELAKLEAIRRAIRKGDSTYVPCLIAAQATADQFRAVFRCPTDAELRMAGRWFAGRKR
jgi:hypothetical protein